MNFFSYQTKIFGCLLLFFLLAPLFASSLQQQIILLTSDTAEDIWKSTNGGSTWTAVNTSFNAGANQDPNVLSMNRSGTLFIIDDDEDVWMSGNFGTSWTKIKDNFNGANTDALALTVDNNNTLVVIDSNEDVWVSWNSGINWTRTVTNLNGANGDVGGLVILSNQTLITADTAEDVWKSTNGGSTWTAVNTSFNAGANQNPNAMAVNQSDTIFIIDDDEDVWVSGNFGTSWTKIKDDFNAGNGDALAMTSDQNNTLYILDDAEDLWVSWNSGFTWNLLSDNMNGGNGDIVGLTAFTNSTDVLAPTFWNISVSPQNNSNYSLTQFFLFNITLQDDVLLDEIILTFNNTNYSSKNGWIYNFSSVYSFNRTGLSAATYPYQWIFNDTSGNRNQTSLQSYTVQRASSALNLTFDGLTGNLTIVVGSTVNITALRTAGEERIYLFRDGSVINEGNPLASNLTLFSTLGTFNITTNYFSTENFTQSFATFFVTAADTTAPTANAPPDAVYVVNSTQTIGWILMDNYLGGFYTVTREGIVVNASAWTNGTNLAIPINSSTLGLWNYTITYNDSVGNQGIADSVIINISSNTSNVQPVVTMQTPINNTFTRFSSVALQAAVFDDDLDALTVFFFGDDAVINITTNVSNGTIVSYNWTGLADGVRNWSAIASDTQMNSTKQYFFFTVDTLAPNLTLFLPQNNSNFTSNINIPLNYSSSDLFLDKTWYALDAGNNQTLTQNTTFNTTYGSHTIVLFANDSANNVQSVSAFFTVTNTTNSSSGSGSGNSGGSPGQGLGSNVQSGDSGLDAIRDNPGLEAPRPQLPSSPSPPSPPRSSEGQSIGSSEQPSPGSTPSITGSAVGSTLKKMTRPLGFFLFGLALLALILAFVLRKRKFGRHIIAKKERPMQFTLKKQQLSFVKKKLQRAFTTLQSAFSRISEAQKQRREYLNTRTSAKKIMAQPMDRLHRLEGLISEEFIANIRKREEKKQHAQEFGHYFPETSKELEEKGLDKPLLAADTVALSHSQLAEKKTEVTTTELKKLFPETIGKSAAFAAEKKIALPSSKPHSHASSTVSSSHSLADAYVFKRIEKPSATHSQSSLATNRKINKKTEKQEMLKGLEEVYDLA